jgi:hypothetical protein
MEINQFIADIGKMIRPVAAPSDNAVHNAALRATRLYQTLDAEMGSLLARSAYLEGSSRVLLHEIPDDIQDRLNHQIRLLSDVRNLLQMGHLEAAEVAYLTYLDR